MRLIDYFPEASITIRPSAQNWQEAVDFSMSSLLTNRYINENYIQAIKIQQSVMVLTIFWRPVSRCLMLAPNAAR
ncbi:PTS system, mannitol-specific enzyme II component, cryptic [Salmonella enterica subsp. arizonae]|uniref:PTS system, mannitol-specific enzyme II component, cryptic n=1 Tax=Salmonella enterica subsp. arizonae TaxID=59203 RepID=A0A379RZ86_SALER|nr:PTS system, mannitol-specific enzyme II component, cryptic [Salmonella enterica subsp. arizonae]